MEKVVTHDMANYWWGSVASFPFTCKSGDFYDITWVCGGSCYSHQENVSKFHCLLPMIPLFLQAAEVKLIFICEIRIEMTVFKSLKYWDFRSSLLLASELYNTE